MIKLFKRIEYRRNRVYRVISHFTNGSFMVGSGFFIRGNQFLTCFHVVFGSEFGPIRQNQLFAQTQGSDDHEKLENYYKSLGTRIEIELHDGLRIIATIKMFDHKYDAVVLEINAPDVNKIIVSKLDYSANFRYGDSLSSCGFPYAVGYSVDHYPFAVHSGEVSGFMDVTVGGEKYEHTQIDSISLGGISGSPVFRNYGREVVGIINGNMIWGRNDLILQTPNGQQTGALNVPLGISYMTPMRLLKEKTQLFSI